MFITGREAGLTKDCSISIKIETNFLEPIFDFNIWIWAQKADGDPEGSRCEG